MAKLLFVLFLISISFKLIAEFSAVNKETSYIQTDQDSNDTESTERVTEKGEKEFNLNFHVLRLNQQNLLEETLITNLKHGEPFPGFTNSTFTPPDFTFL